MTPDFFAHLHKAWPAAAQAAQDGLYDLPVPDGLYGPYYRRYVRWMRKAKQALEKGDLMRAVYCCETALSWKRTAKRKLAK